MRTRFAPMAVVALLAVAPAAQAGFLGATLDATYYYPNTSTPYASASFSPSIFVVGAGVETVGQVEGVTFLPVDFTDGTLTIGLDTVLSDPTWLTSSFNGVLFTLQSPGTLGIAGATIDPATTLAGFGADRVTFDDHRIGINWQGLSYRDGQQVVVNFAFVPEPSSVVAMGLGVVGVAGLARLRRRPAA